MVKPLEVGQEIGYLSLLMDGEEFRRFPLVTLDAVNEGSVISSLWDKANLLFETVFDFKCLPNGIFNLRCALLELEF